MANEEELLDEEEGEEYNIIAIVIAALLVLAVIGGAIWYFYFRKPPETTTGFKLPEWEAPKKSAEDLVFDGLPKLIVNPQDSNGRYYLQVKVDLAFNRDMSGELMGKPWLLSQAENTIIDVFSSYTVAELQTPKFKEEARKEIKKEFNRLLGWTDEAQSDSTETEKDPKKLPPIKEVYLVTYMLQ